MVPVKDEKSGKNILKCTKCGYKVGLKNELINRYRLSQEIDFEKRVITAKATKSVKRALTPEEREMLQEYYEVFLESFETEETSSESD